MLVLVLLIAVILLAAHCLDLERKIKRKQQAISTLTESVDILLSIIGKFHPKVHARVIAAMGANCKLNRKEMQDL